MRKPTIFAAFLCIGALGCEAFTAGESVSDPDPASVRSAQVASARAAALAVNAATKSAEKAAPTPDPEAEAERIRKAHEAVPAAAAQPVETATAAHILIRYVGTMRAGPEVTRSKEDAKKLADKLLAQAKKKGANFAELADKYTEDPSGKGRGGQLGTFPRGRMVPEFDKATFALAPGQVSPTLVETAFGYHIIYREK